MSDPSSVFVAPEARTAERFLLDELARALPRPAPTAPLPPPVRVVVPSRSLRRHLLAALARERPAWLGLEVTTLFDAALTIVRATGELPPKGDTLFGLLLERTARRRPPLLAACGDFADGWSALVGAARDLVDAGFGSEHQAALSERIEAERGALSVRSLDRARALLTALAATLETMRSLGLEPGSATYGRAARLLSERGDSLLPSSALWIHGFADATGVAGDLLEALVRHSGAAALLVDPSDLNEPVDRIVESSERCAFGRRLRERLEGAGGRAQPIAPLSTLPSLRMFTAPTPALEVRAVARAVGEAIDDGVPAERIAIVLRSPESHRSPLARELARNGVPYSASADHGPIAPRAHRARALLRLLEAGARAPVDTALDLHESAGAAAEQRPAVRLALRAFGWDLLGEAARAPRPPLEIHRDSGVPLPARAGLEADADRGASLPRQRLPLPVLLDFLDWLRELLARLERWPDRGTWNRYSDALAALLDICKLDQRDERDELLGALAAVELELPDDFELMRSEALALVASAWRRSERLPWGGNGGGVQLLSVTEARGLTFDRLFVLGLTRGGFPRPVAEEPVLPDALRLRLRDLLTELPVKRDGHDEERYLFAQLVGAAPEVVLSRALRDADGRLLSASPLLERLERDGRLLPFSGPEGAPLPPLDRAIQAALAGREAGVAPHLAPALEEGRQRFSPGSIASTVAAAAARLRVLAEFERLSGRGSGRQGAARLGPFFGLLGVLPDEPIAATTLEEHAKCGWRAFLERTLRLEPLPDPFAALPTIDPRLLGSALHDALARLFADLTDPADPADPIAAGEASVAARLDSPGRPLLWPDAAEIERVATAAAAAALRRAGLARRGLERPLTERIVQRLAVARAADAARSEALLLGVELAGELPLRDSRGHPTTVRFRADRLLRLGNTLTFTDFKAGAVPPSLAKKRATTRRKGLERSIRSGERLQASIYALAAAPRVAEGAYLFLAPDDDAPEREIALPGDKAAFVALRDAATTLLDARRLGLFPPRLLEPSLDSTYEGCKRCAVAEACVQGDSAFRLRLEKWHEEQLGSAERNRPGDPDDLQVADDLERALWRHWRLRAKPQEPL